MSDDFGTVNVRASARSREIEMIRQHYRAHRDTLASLAGEAPSEHLAAEYHRLIADIDTSLRKLDELEGHAPAAAAPTPSSPASRPLIMTPAEGHYQTSPGSGASSGARVLLMLLIAVAVLGAIGWLIWRASSERKTNARPPAVAQTSTTTSTAPAETGTVTPLAQPAAAASMRITPAVQDYGIIRKGTRAVRQFELINAGTIPISIEVARSTCRCLYYDYNNKKVAPNAHETITVTVDAARARTPTVDEQLTVTAKEDPSATATIGVRATIK